MASRVARHRLGDCCLANDVEAFTPQPVGADQFVFLKVISHADDAIEADVFRRQRRILMPDVAAQLPPELFALIEATSNAGWSGAAGGFCGLNHRGKDERDKFYPSFSRILNAAPSLQFLFQQGVKMLA